MGIIVSPPAKQVMAILSEHRHPVSFGFLEANVDTVPGHLPTYVETLVAVGWAKQQAGGYVLGREALRGETQLGEAVSRIRWYSSPLDD